MLYAIMCTDSWGDVEVYAIRETYEAAEKYAAHLNDAEEDHYWVITVEDDGGIGDYLEGNYTENSNY